MVAARELAVSAAVLRLLNDPWAASRRLNQTAPEGDWRTWLFMAGRGAGKTRAGAEWVREVARDHPGCRIALVAATAADARDVMVEGESGILAVCGRYGINVVYEPSKRRLTWPNGSMATTYSADEPNRLRGPQHAFAWSDEIAAWRYPETWDQLQFGLRLGTNPRVMATTTPKPVRLVRDLMAQVSTGRVVVTTGSTFDNRDNLAPQFVEQILAKYQGTRLGAQEIEGVLLEDVQGALWSWSLLDECRAMGSVPQLERVVVAIDPAASAGEDSAETGIIVVGKDGTGRGWVIDDASVKGTPIEWARAAVSAFDRWRADRVIAESNQGGLMVEQVLRTVRPNLPVQLVHASRGKLTRAEPVAALYEQGMVRHAAAFRALEEQMTTYDGSGDSPDRMDALVWGLTALLVSDAPAVAIGSWMGGGDG